MSASLTCRRTACWSEGTRGREPWVREGVQDVVVRRRRFSARGASRQCGRSVARVTNGKHLTTCLSREMIFAVVVTPPREMGMAKIAISTQPKQTKKRGNGNLPTTRCVFCLVSDGSRADSCWGGQHAEAYCRLEGGRLFAQSRGGSTSRSLPTGKTMGACAPQKTAGKLVTQSRCFF